MSTLNGLFTEAARRVKPETVVKIAREARPPSDYFFAKILPERTLNAREVSSSTFILRSVMAGLVPMDGNYPEGLAIQGKDFKERLAKIAIQQSFNEGDMVVMQEMLKNLLLTKGAGAGVKMLIQNFLNFADKLLVQPHLDTTEWLRAQALRTGAIDWKYGTQRLQVNYGIPAAALATNRTSTDGYGGSASKFWTDILAAKTYLKNRVQVFVAHADTINMIISNSANSLRVIGEFEDGFDVVKYVGTNETNSTETRFRCRLVSYNVEAEVLDTSDPKVAKTKIVQFLPAGEILAIGRPDVKQGFYLTDNVDQGSTQDPSEFDPLGFTAIGPVTENDGQPGRWARIYTPENKPASLIGQAVSNVLPVIENEKSIYRLKTEMV